MEQPDPCRRPLAGRISRRAVKAPLVAAGLVSSRPVPWPDPGQPTVSAGRSRPRAVFSLNQLECSKQVRARTALLGTM